MTPISDSRDSDKRKDVSDCLRVLEGVEGAVGVAGGSYLCEETTMAFLFHVLICFRTDSKCSGSTGMSGRVFLLTVPHQF